MGYRQIGRPLSIFRVGGAVIPASDDEVIATAEGWEGRWVNLVLDRGLACRLGHAAARPPVLHRFDLPS